MNTAEAGDRGGTVLMDVLRNPLKTVGVENDSTSAPPADWARDTGISSAVVAGEGADRPAGPPVVSQGDCLEVSGLGLTLPNGRRLLSDVSFGARPGSLTAIIGPLGCRQVDAGQTGGRGHHPDHG